MFGQPHRARRYLFHPILAFGFLVTPLLTAAQQNPPAAQQGGQPQAQAASVPRVAIGEINGNPGSNLMVPLYFTPDPNKPLRSITIEIEYVSNSLKFQRAAAGLAVEQVGADISSTLTDGTPDARNVTRSKLRIAVNVPASQPAKGIPDGLLSFLMFRVSSDARPFAIRLNTSVVAAETTQTPPQRVANVSTLPGLVVVEQGDMLPEATCFFFTH
jgi:hypothetical protein